MKSLGSTNFFGCPQFTESVITHSDGGGRWWLLKLMMSPRKKLISTKGDRVKYCMWKKNILLSSRSSGQEFLGYPPIWVKAYHGRVVVVFACASIGF